MLDFILVILDLIQQKQLISVRIVYRFKDGKHTLCGIQGIHDILFLNLQLLGKPGNTWFLLMLMYILLLQLEGPIRQIL